MQLLSFFLYLLPLFCAVLWIIQRFSLKEKKKQKQPSNIEIPVLPPNPRPPNYEI